MTLNEKLICPSTLQIRLEPKGDDRIIENLVLVILARVVLIDGRNKCKKKIINTSAFF